MSTANGSLEYIGNLPGRTKVAITSTVSLGA